MKTRYLKVQGDVATPLPDRLQDKATHSLELTNAKYDAYVSPFYFKVIDGLPVAKTQAEIDADQLEKDKQNAINEANALYKQLKQNRVINGYDLTDSFEFDFQRKQNGNVRLKKASGKTEVKTKQETDALEASLFSYLNNVADALDADMDAIELGDFSLSNLKALE